MVLEARKPRTRCRLLGILVNFLFLACRWPSSCCVLPCVGKHSWYLSYVHVSSSGYQTDWIIVIIIIIGLFLPPQKTFLLTTDARVGLSAQCDFQTKSWKKNIIAELYSWIKIQLMHLNGSLSSFKGKSSVSSHWQYTLEMTDMG